jgi:hypothetical protein
LDDNSLHIKEYTLDILLQLNQSKKLSDSDLFLVLYKYINDQSILIRRKITKIIIKIVEDKEKEIEHIHMKNIISIFLNKLSDLTESQGIKTQIVDFFSKNLKNLKKRALAGTKIDILISILNEKEDLKNNVNMYYDNMSNFIQHVKNIT